MDANHIKMFSEIDLESSHALFEDVFIADDGSPITLRLSSPGGSVYDALAMYDLLLSLKAYKRGELTIIGTGAVMSSAVVVLQAANKRILTPNATLMIHPVSEYLERQRDTANLVRDAEEAARLNYLFAEILARKMQVEPAEIISLYGSNTYLTAQEAVKLGLADSVLGKRVRR